MSRQLDRPPPKVTEAGVSEQPWPRPADFASASKVSARLPWGAALAAACGLAWLAVAPRTPDLAAQFYRQWLFSHQGFALWDNYWYAGHHIPGYSLIFPALADLIGLRLLGVLAVIASAALFEACVRAYLGRRVLAAELWFAVSCAGDIWIGRLTFALGVSFAVAACLLMLRLQARPRRRRALMRAGLILCSAAAAASSPVAGLLLAFAAISWAAAVSFTNERKLSALLERLRSGSPLIGPALIVCFAIQGLFPEGGFEPFAGSSLAAVSAVTVAFMVALPRSERWLRAAASIYLLCVLLSEIPTPMGSNVQRYAVLLAGPMLLIALSRGAPTAGRALGFPRQGAIALMRAAALIGIGFWVLWGPLTQTAEVIGEPSTRAGFYAPLEGFLSSLGPGPLRIEVPFTRAHWEAALLAEHVALARGWERQLDKRYNEAIESPSLSAGQYLTWLERYGVSYVALPQEPFDESSFAEVRLIRSGLPYLKEVKRAGHWRIFKVQDPSPLMSAVQPAAHRGANGAPPEAAQAAGRLIGIGHESFALQVSSPGRFLVKVHFTPYWQVRIGQARLRESAEGFTEVLASRSGTVEVGAAFTLGAAINSVWQSL